MRGALSVLWFELEERRMLFAASLLLGLLALTAPLLPFYRHWGSGDVREAAALGVAGALLLLSSLGVGSGILAGEVTAGRESFYLARPVGTLALWAGRLGAAVVVALLAPALALLPAWLLNAWSNVELVKWGVLSLVLVPALVAAGALVRLTLRARSIWLLVLAVGMVVAYGVQLRLVLMPAVSLALSSGGRSGAVPFLAIPIAWSIALLAGSAAAAVRGRTDLARASGWGAGVAVLGLAILTGALAAGFSWALKVTPRDLESIGIVQCSPDGPWTVLSGRASRGGFHRYTTFLANVDDGRWERHPHVWGPVCFSGDGRFLALAEPDNDAGRSAKVMLVRVLGLPAGPDRMPETVRTLAVGSVPRWTALSRDGKRVLTIFGDHFTVWDVASGRPLARVRERVAKNLLSEVDDDGGVWLVLPTGKNGRSEESGIEVRRLAQGSRSTVAVWRAAPLDPGLEVLHPAGVGRDEVIAFFMRDGEGNRVLSVRRVRTGEELWSAPLEDPRTPHEALPVAGERVLVTVRRGRRGPAAVVLMTPDGVRWKHEIGTTDLAVVVPGPETGTVVLLFDRDPGPGLLEPYCERLDLAAGRTVPIGEGIRPAATPWLWHWQRLPRVGSRAARLFVRGLHELVLLGGDGRLEPVPFH